MSRQNFKRIFPLEVVSADREKYAAAKAHVAALKGFYIHLIVFAAVMTGLIAADFVGGGKWWVQWPLIGWGIGLSFHAYMVFARRGHTVSDWEEKKIKETLSKM